MMLMMFFWAMQIERYEIYDRRIRIDPVSRTLCERGEFLFIFIMISYAVSAAAKENREVH